jgi:hypothetical protein
MAPAAAPQRKIGASEAPVTPFKGDTSSGAVGRVPVTTAVEDWPRRIRPGCRLVDDQQRFGKLAFRGHAAGDVGIELHREIKLRKRLAGGSWSAPCAVHRQIAHELGQPVGVRRAPK